MIDNYVAIDVKQFSLWFQGLAPYDAGQENPEQTSPYKG
jgi:hypothetical protein